MKRLLLGVLAFGLLHSAEADYTLTLLHTNDLHAHFEPTKIKGQEFGGYARLATLIKSLSRTSKNPLVLNGGDTFQGTMYFNMYHGLADIAVMNTMGYKAAAIGNHEFDLGPKALADFANLATFPLVASNLDVHEDPDLRDVVKNYVIIQMPKDDEDADKDKDKDKKSEKEKEKEKEKDADEGERIGIVGAITPDLPDISSPGPTIHLKPIVESIQRAIEQVKAYDCNKIILVSHCGYGVEQELATKLKGVDIIVGGHSHTLLGNVTLPGDIHGLGDYPTVVKNADGDTTLVVQSYEWGKVLGKLEVTFDDDGKIEKWSQDQPIPVTAQISEDPEVKSMIAAFKMPIAEMMNKEVGTTSAEIPRSGPGAQGPMADMICDSMLEATKPMGSVVAFMNAGGVRSGLNPGKISFGDAISVQPFNNTLVVVDLTGAEVKEAMETGILFVSRGTSFTRGADNKVSDVIVAGAPLDLAKTYRCTFNNFVANGGDKVTTVKNTKGRKIDTGLLDIDAFLQYIKAHTPLNLKGEARIKGN